MHQYRVRCFIPKKFIYLSNYKKIRHKNHNLKTAYLAHIMNELLAKQFLTDAIDHALYSIILKKMYGKYYNYYIDYLVSINFISLTKNKLVSVSSRRYKINEHILKDKITRVDFYDKKLREKVNKKRYETSLTSYSKSPIPEYIRKKLVDNLDYIQIDYKNAIYKLMAMKKDNEINQDKFFRNMVSLQHINQKMLRYAFDSHGRIHTNYTNLKKIFRTKYVTIDNMRVAEIDIPNSQPLFLATLIHDNYEGRVIPEPLKDFIYLADKGLFYDDFYQKNKNEIKSRNECKKITFRVLFGKNTISSRNNPENNKANKLFKKNYPELFEYIKKFKGKDYKSLARHLQRKESEFIFDKVIGELIKVYPNIHFFTVHDSIVCPEIYYEDVKKIYDVHRSRLFNKPIV